MAAPGDKVKGIELRGAFCMSGSGLSFINVTTWLKLGIDVILIILNKLPIDTRFRPQIVDNERRGDAATRKGLVRRRNE